MFATKKLQLTLSLYCNKIECINLVDLFIDILPGPQHQNFVGLIFLEKFGAVR